MGLNIPRRPRVRSVAQVEAMKRRERKRQYMIAQLKPISPDADADGFIDRISIFESDIDTFAIAFVTSDGTMTMQLSTKSLRRFRQMLMKVENGVARAQHFDMV